MLLMRKNMKVHGGFSFNWTMAVILIPADRQKQPPPFVTYYDDNIFQN